MHAETFLKELAPLAGGPGGIQKLRELVLQLAVRGKLVPQNASDGDAERILSSIKDEADSATKQRWARYVSPDAIYGTPSSWRWTAIGRMSRDWGQKAPDKPFLYIDVSGIDNQKGKISEQLELIQPEDAPSRARKLVERGTVIYSTVRPYLRNIAIVDREFSHQAIASTAFAIVHPLGGILPEYVFHYLRSPDFVSYVEGQMMGVAYPAINDSKFFTAPIPLPPIAEQKRIVAKVNELMALCDELEARQAEESGLKRAAAASALHHLTEAKTPEETADRWSLLTARFEELFDDLEVIKALRKTIFDLAVTGKLSSRDIGDDDPELALAKIEDARQQTISSGIINRLSDIPSVSEEEVPYEVPSTWGWIRYNSQFRFIDYRGRTPPKTESGFPLITAKNVRRGYIDREPREFISERTFQEWMTRGFPEVGDILLTVEAPLGNAAVVNITEPFALAQRVICLQPWARELSNSAFTQIAILSPLGQKQLQSQATGMTATGIRAAKLKLIPLPFPPLAEQKRIVAKVDELIALCDRLEEQLREGERLNAELIASLVHALTETGPDGGGMAGHTGLADEVQTFASPEATDRSTSEALETKSARTDSMAKPEDRAASDRVPGVDTKFQEAVLVGAIVNAFFEVGGEPIGNFRLQKAVYFARRHNGEHVDQMAYLKKAAGPYNPSMKYSGGIAIAKQKNWLREARGRFGFGHVPGEAAGETDEWIARYGYGESARWVAEHFRFKKNEEWETLATVDYAMEHLQSLGVEADAEQVLQYIRADDEWRPKVEKLGLSEIAIEAAMVEVKALFGAKAS